MRQMAIAALSVLSLSAQDSAPVWKHYQKHEAPKLLPWLQEVIRFPTVAGNTQAWTDQKVWLQARAEELGFAFKDTGAVFEIELPGPPVEGKAAPVIGLVIHGDVQPVDASHWSFPPFAGTVKDGSVIGRGAADDKGPLVQALLAMKALKESGLPRTHTLRMLVGSDEESGSSDMGIYLKDHRAPDYSLVLDSAFPVVAGEKAWNALTVETDLANRGSALLEVASLRAGLAPSIVPDEATVQVQIDKINAPYLADLEKRISRKHPPQGTRLGPLVAPLMDHKASGSSTVERVPQDKNAEASPNEWPSHETLASNLTVHGKAAHAGVNAEGGRNALVALADLVTDELPDSGAKDLLAFARLAGQNLTGTGLGLTQTDPIFGKATVVPTLLQMEPDGKAKLTINIRSTPALSGEALKAHLFAQIAAFNAKTGAHLEPGGFFADTPLVFDPQAKLIKRLMADYTKATGEHPAPAISGGGTYAKRIPNAIAFGMWFPDKPYPGHDVDEKVPVADLERGEKVLIETLVDLACGAPIQEPFKP
ncbi:MAG TPA: M20/M25/M40 family metallo-hydrolase [Holophagaceae bacterium]|nr:M20/M25/M40 family metallo-hydrolase [Holophagaceae bacterium]